MNREMIPGRDIIKFSRYYMLVRLIMKTPKDDTHKVEDTEENLEKCICKMCPTFKKNNLADYPPTALFCARGKSKIPSDIKTTNCYCLGCDIYIKHGLVISHLCVHQ
jgi:hypothetical protein